METHLILLAIAAVGLWLSFGMLYLIVKRDRRNKKMQQSPPEPRPDRQTLEDLERQFGKRG